LKLFSVCILEYLVCGFGPDERVTAVVPAVDEGADLGVEVLDRAEGAAVDGLLLDDAEPDLDQVEPRPGGRGKCTWMRGFAASQSRTSALMWAA
jgi:hypothetical protein